MEFESPLDGQVDMNTGGTTSLVETAPESKAYFLENNRFVSVLSHIGPWDRTAAPSITINVTPQPTTSTVDNYPGRGNDLNIFIGNGADVNNYPAIPTGSGFAFYGIRKLTVIINLIHRGQNPIFQGKLHNGDIKTCLIRMMDSMDYKQHPSGGHHLKSAARGSLQGVQSSPIL